jgi:MYXO-CTERM domain-containing protein
MRNLVGLLFLFGLTLAATPRAAHAGSCPTCTTAADCAGGFCVIHDTDVGCGTALNLCCPGQGCAIDGNGRPSCEAGNTCAVMCGSMADCLIGGVQGTCVMSPSSAASWCQVDDNTCTGGKRWGMSAGDGLAGVCVDAVGPDAAPGTPDAAPGSPDAGTGTGKSDGCGCHTPGRGSAPVGTLIAFGAIAMLLVIARRRR